MKSANPVFSLTTALALGAILGSMPALTRAAQTDIAQIPLGTAPTATVLPNLMYTLDDSGSMFWDYMPDNVQVNSSQTLFKNCKSCSSNSSCSTASVICSDGYNGSNATSTLATSVREPPFASPHFNQAYYNPDITYKAGVDHLGASLGNASPTAAMNDAFLDKTTVRDLTAGYPDIYYCINTVNSASFPNDRTDPNKCRRNGVDNVAAAPNNYFLYWKNSLTAPFGGFPNATPKDDTKTFRVRFIHTGGNAHYFKIAPHEYCKDENLVECQLANADGSAPVGFDRPAPIRYCSSENDAASTSAVSSPATTGNPKCRKNFDAANFKFPRYGRFTRVDIVPGFTYATSPTSKRTDCASATACTYAEELQNFANWYSYYRTRMMLMKTTSGRVFAELDDRYRIGFLTLNASNSAKYLKIDKFVSTHKSNWFTKFYQQVPGGGTPLRQALSRVGRHYAGVTTGINSFMPDDPVQYSCQQNYVLLTTDGYWNGSGGQKIDGTDILNQDNVENTTDPLYVSRSKSVTFDGNLSGTAGSNAGSSNTLADVAMYYYKTDLRPTMKNDVPTTAKDIASHQHMVTFTLGLGLDGLMSFRQDYETATTGDFAKIRAEDPVGCSWTSGKCNWPQAQENTPSALDDLWHAAVNGRGVYFSAKDPNSLQSGIATALSTLKQLVGSAAASATSTPNITPTDNFIYSATYRTVKWDGEIVAERINTASGAVESGVVWSASSQLNGRPTASSDDRSIYTLDPAGATKLKSFLYTNLSTNEKTFFDNKCIPADLPQCGAMAPAQFAAANSGDNLVKWLRGQTGNEGTLYRDRENVLGDIVNAKPAFVAAPNLQYGDLGYDTFRSANAKRQSVLYIAANDGMLHAFNGEDTPNEKTLPSLPPVPGGSELWAYVPRIVMPQMYKLAATNYDVKHRYYVDGSPVTMDVFFASAGAWKTILVGGLNAGGRGYYALDVTDPNSPKGLWEVCADPTGELQCTDKDDNIGLTYGQPIITKDAKDGRWVVMVTSGYNNVSPGDGKGYIFIIDAETGKIIDKKDNGVGDTVTPSGFARISGFAVNFAQDNTTPFVYGGDLLGNVFLFDVKNRQFQIIGQARDASGKMQSITTRPEVTCFDPPLCVKRVVYVGTGRLLGGTDIPDPETLTPPVLDLAYRQTVYGFKDTGGNLGDLRAPGANLVPQFLSVVDPTTRTISSNAVDWNTQNGWFVDLNPSDPPGTFTPPGDSPGERVTIDPQLVKGVFIVVTNEPNSDACSTGGDSFFYQFDYRTGSYIASAPSQVVGIKMASALAAGFVVYRLPSGQLKYTGIDVTGKKHTGGVNPGGSGSVGSRASWRELY